MSPEDVREAIEHRNMLIDLQTVLDSVAGRRFIKYVLKSFDVGEMPPQGLEPAMLSEYLGLLRAGNAIFKIVAQASPQHAGMMLAEIEKEKYDAKELERVEEDGRNQGR